MSNQIVAFKVMSKAVLISVEGDASLKLQRLVIFHLILVDYIRSDEIGVLSNVIHGTHTYFAFEV